MPLKKSKERHDRILIWTTTRNWLWNTFFKIFGEVARNVSQDFQNAHPEIPCKAIIGVRHKVAHDYLNVDQDIVWDMVT